MLIFEMTFFNNYGEDVGIYARNEKLRIQRNYLEGSRVES